VQKYIYTVGQHNSRERLDLFLSEQTLPLTRSQIKKLIDTQHVTVNQVLAKASCRIKKGDLIEVHLQEPRKPSVEPENIPLEILFEDDHIVVVNKPAGMVVHPAAGNYSGTLVNALLFHCSFLSGVGGILRPGIVHRLDKGTSGVLLVAKNDIAHQSLSNQFKSRSVKKIYLALVSRQMEEDEGKIETEIGRHCSDRKKMSTHTRKGRSAVTRWKVLKKYKNYSLLEVRIQTGRTHQIRVHLSSLHHPIIGDNVYGGKKCLSNLKDVVIKNKLNSLQRPFLHAHLLGFQHPQNNQYQEFIANLPEELNEILTVIESEKCL
jgi:23S rRNA pseudouridine1911/1915/1917 synthase